MFGKIKTDSKFLEFINFSRMFSRVSDILSYDEYVEPFGDYVMIDSEDFDTISYIPKSKVSISDGFRDEKYRTKMKIGRFVSKIIPERVAIRFDIRAAEIEKFVNLFKSYFDVDPSKFKVVSGDEILKWYLDKNYHLPAGRAAGTLWNSCMRYFDKNQFMKIYADNPDKIKMLISLDEDGNLRTRALLWEDCIAENGTTYKVMDRIYSIYDHEVNTFKKWAIENGYIHKLDQSSKNENHFMTKNGAEIINLKVKLDNYSFDFYPYMDTFKFFNRKAGIFRNWNHSKMNYIMVQNNGILFRDRDGYLHDEDIYVTNQNDVDFDLDGDFWHPQEIPLAP